MAERTHVHCNHTTGCWIIKRRMKNMITILCAGFRGDFQPYIDLSQELKKLGKDVRITGMRDMEEFIRSYGIDFYSMHQRPQ